jgi:hypothetical protein
VSKRRGASAIGRPPPGCATAGARLLVTLAGVLTLLGPGVPPAGATGERDEPGSPVLLDATGRLVGAVEGMGSLATVTVAIRAAGWITYVDVTRDRILQGTGVIGFEDAGCAEAPFLMPEEGAGAPLLHGESGIGPPNVLFRPTGAVHSRTIVATWRPEATDPCVTQLPTSEEVFAVVPLVDLGVFVPPFGVR